MELEDQVCSLESARRLKELGVKQNSLFYWHECSYSSSGHKRWWVLNHEGDLCILDSISAFTVAELGKMLPDNVIGILRLNGGEHSIGIRFENAEYKVFRDKNEAELRAKMLIYLLENKLWLPQ